MVQMYKCDICGNIFIVGYNAGPVPVCCGKPMRLITANTEEAAFEKHIPCVTVDGDTVEIIGLPKNKEVVISESQGYYISNWKLNDGELTHGDSAAVTLTGDATLTFINRYDPPAPTQIAIKFTPFIIMDIIGLALFALVWTSRKKRRGGDSV